MKKLYQSRRDSLGNKYSAFPTSHFERLPPTDGPNGQAEASLAFLVERQTAVPKKAKHGRQKYFYLVYFYLVFLFSSFVYSASPAQDSTILIRSANTDLTEFSAYAETEPIKTYAQYQLNRNRKTPRPIMLQSILKQAQMEFLSYEPDQSKKKFRLITEHLHSFDWNTEERKIIFYSLFRLAQLEKDLQKQKLLLQEAFVFGINLKLDLQLFPPPLVELYLKLKKEATFVSLHLKKLFPAHEIVIINGKIHSNKEKVTLPYGMYRVTALSSSHTSQTQTLSLSRLISQNLKTSSLVDGSCQQPILSHLDNNLKKDQIRILFPNFCVWNSLQDQIVKTQQNILPADIKMVEGLKQAEQNPGWWEEEWLWIGTAMVLGATMVFVLSRDTTTKKDKKKTNPQVKIGF